MPAAVTSRATASSMASSSIPNTTSPAALTRVRLISASSASRRSEAVTASSARTVTRTLMPSIPLARKAMVAPVPVGPASGPSSWAMCAPSVSARPDSLIPQVRMTRLAMTPVLSPRSAIRRRRSGTMPRSNMSDIS